MKREQIQKTKVKQRAAQAVEELGSKRPGDALATDLDDLLDEIDSVLEENAEEFVQGYVQKGGE